MLIEDNNEMLKTKIKLFFLSLPRKERTKKVQLCHYLLLKLENNNYNGCSLLNIERAASSRGTMLKLSGRKRKCIATNLR